MGAAMRKAARSLLVASLLLACAEKTVLAPAPPGPPATLTAKSFALADAKAPAFVDYVAFERARSRVWLPVGSEGKVYVFDTAGGSFATVDGFVTAERAVHGKKRTVGPTAVAIGEGAAYVGNRATNEVCVVDVVSLKKGACTKVPAALDGVAFVADAKEVWVTQPDDESIAVLDAADATTLKTKATIKVDGAPEGYATARNLFFTNLEDKDQTLVVPTDTHSVRSAWQPQCGKDGPRGIAVDGARGFVFVACTDHVAVLDGRNGSVLARLDTGAGVDNIDWLDDRQFLYVAASKAAKLTVARFDDKGQPTVVATGVTSEGARNAVADDKGNAYVVDALSARLLVFALPAR